MLGTLIALVAIAAGSLAWLQARAAAELARGACVRACRDAGVQLLDHSVALASLRLRRRDDGWIALLRRYDFEFSTDGSDRLPGRLEMLAGRIRWIRLTEPPAT